MLFFELFPAFMLIACIPVIVWLAAMDRQARRRPATEKTPPLPRPRLRS